MLCMDPMMWECPADDKSGMCTQIGWGVCVWVCMCVEVWGGGLLQGFFSAVIICIMEFVFLIQYVCLLILFNLNAFDIGLMFFLLLKKRKKKKKKAFRL